MHLVCQAPVYKKEVMVTQSSIYFKTKELFGLLQSADVVTKELVQAGVIITVYEYGHGLSRPAFLTVGACMRLALALRWNNMEDSVTSLSFEEERRTWWAIYLLDRLIYLDRNPASTTPASEKMITNMGLPIDDETWDRSPDMLELVDPYHGTARYQAEAGQLLECVINHISGPGLSPETKKHLEQDLSDKLIAFALHATEHSERKWGANCGTLGVTYGALLLLHQQNIKGKSPEAISDLSQPSIFELRRTISIMVDIAHDLNPYLNGFDFLPIPPLTCYAVFQAALVHIQMAEDMYDTGWDAEFQALKCMMIGFRRRWALAGKHICIVQEAYERKLLGCKAVPSTDVRAQWRSSVGI